MKVHQIQISDIRCTDEGVKSVNATNLAYLIVGQTLVRSPWRSYARKHSGIEPDGTFLLHNCRHAISWVRVQGHATVG